MENLLRHLQCSPADIGKYVLLPGDPGRVSYMAGFLENARFVHVSREFTIWTGSLCGESVSVISTGMGGPSTAICVEELKQCGVHTLIRVGGCGGIDESLVPGTLIIPTGAIRKEGTSHEYVPIEYPSVPNFEVVTALKTAAEKLGFTHALGVVECKDNFYGQHAPETMPAYHELLAKWEAWKMAGALASEMESAALFIVAGIRRMRAGTVLMLCGNKERAKALGTTETCYDYTTAIQTAVEALRILIESDRASQTDEACAAAE